MNKYERIIISYRSRPINSKNLVGRALLMCFVKLELLLPCYTVACISFARVSELNCAYCVINRGTVFVLDSDRCDQEY